MNVIKSLFRFSHTKQLCNSFIPLANAGSLFRQGKISCTDKIFCPLSNRHISYGNKLFHDTIVPSSLALDNVGKQIKRIYKKRTASDIKPKEDEGQFIALAYATANSYDLEAIKIAFTEQKLYEPSQLSNMELQTDVLYARAKYSVGSEPRQMFIFQEGAAVFWNCSELEANNVLDFLRQFQRESYPQDVIEREKEVMMYTYQPPGKKSHLQDIGFFLSSDGDNSLELYTFSNAMAQSVKLGAWEANLETLAESIRKVTSEMEHQTSISMTREDVVRKAGELFALRHRINVESDLLDTPDFYWEQHELEKLYSRTVAYFSISQRTRVLNSRLDHCVELMELLSTWLSDRHHVRLEWMIIILIMVEVAFETLHFLERYLPFLGL